MGHLARSTVVACPPEAVYDLLTRVDRLPELSDMTVSVEGPGRPVEVSDSFEQVVKVLGKELDSTWQVVDLRPSSELRFRGDAPVGASATLTERLTPTGEGTRVDFEVEYDLPLGILGAAVDAVLLRAKAEEMAEEILVRLKALCEGTAASS